MDGLITDSFAGGGGASLGIELATGRSPDIAVNHDEAAICMHQANHPDTLHLLKNIWKVDPVNYVKGRKVWLSWFSPDCKHFSKAKGGKPVSRSIRDLAWVVVLWAQRVRPSIIMLENVEEFSTWGPLKDDNRPCPIRKGETFKKWCRELRKLGYRVEFRELRACDYGVPTIRKRLFMIARCDGKPIVWPEATHGPANDNDVIAGRKLPYLTAAHDVVDWSLPCPSIFLTKEEGRALNVKRPLAHNTMIRIAKGVYRYVIDAKDPFIVPRGHADIITPVMTYAQHGGATRSPDGPMHTITASKKDQNAIIVPHLSRQFGNSVGSDVSDPVGSVMPGGGGKTALVSAFLAQHNTGVVGHHAETPLSTITQRATQQNIVAASMINLKGSDRRMSPAVEPVQTITSGGNHIGEVRAFLTKYYGQGGQYQDLREPLHTVPTRDRMGLVMVAGEPYQITDIGMRMLTPRELFRAQGFPDSYIIDPLFNGKPLSRTKQTEKCGNSVPPIMPKVLIRANMDAADLRQVA